MRSDSYREGSSWKAPGLLCAIGDAAEGLAVPSLASDEEFSGPIDCGPPPKAKPQHRTAGEAFAPLPLPVTPLRRSEKKRPPSPPALVGKMAMGPVRWIARNGKRLKYRDWMTDPADIKTLLEWTSQKLGIHYRSLESDFTHFSYDPRELPALLLAGHNHFQLDDQVREKLARYVLDGGTILGDACCGWKNFTESFRKEMELIFPGRPLRKMLPEEPVFASYYKLGTFTYKKADGSTYMDEPCLEGIEFGCPHRCDLLALQPHVRLGRSRTPVRHPRDHRPSQAGSGQYRDLHSE